MTNYTFDPREHFSHVPNAYPNVKTVRALFREGLKKNSIFFVYLHISDHLESKKKSGNLTSHDSFF